MPSTKLQANNFPEFDGHELVLLFEDRDVGLKGFIAIHNTKLGPATGGTRYWKYSSEEEALRDVLNLSKAMTYKCALAGVPHGGGKAVIIANPQQEKTEALLKAYAQKVNQLNGNFSTGEDVGIDENDVRILSKYSNFINGRPGVGGDASPWTALGVFYAIQSSLQFLFGSPNTKNRTFAIKGVGKVGRELCHLLYENGGKITIADTDPTAVKSIRISFPDVGIATPLEIHRKPVDIYCPCALGNEFNKQMVTELQCKIICGGANNQLLSSEIGKILYQKGIIYVPDYVANAGGLINVVDELDERRYSRERVEIKVGQIREMVKTILDASKKNSTPTNQVADEFAQEIFLNRKSLRDILTQNDTPKRPYM